MFFLITWTIYGSWLPGDPRGFRTYHKRQTVPSPERYADEDEVPYEPKRYIPLYSHSASKSSGEVKLNWEQMKAACDVIVQTAVALGVRGTVAVLPQHVHIVVEMPEEITTGFFCNRVKSKSSLRLSDYGLKGKVWARRYHAKRISEEKVIEARRYVQSHRQEGAVISEFGF
jgi:REP element-mobilizing transposase RayT